MGLRGESTISYKLLVKRTLVRAIKAAFTMHPDAEFENFRVTTDFPMSKQQYPSVYVRFDSGITIANAGVGHQEFFRDSHGVMRRWGHRRFSGTLELVVLALSPNSRDMLLEALTEMIAFGRLDPVLGMFYETIYGGPSEEITFARTLSQISLNTDEFTAGGESATVAPWAPEDVLVYSGTISIPLQGGFYNSDPQDRIDYISGVKLNRPTEQAHFTVDNNGAWVFPFQFDDTGSATGTAQISGPDQRLP